MCWITAPWRPLPHAWPLRCNSKSSQEKAIMTACLLFSLVATDIKFILNSGNEYLVLKQYEMEQWIFWSTFIINWIHSPCNLCISSKNKFPMTVDKVNRLKHTVILKIKVYISPHRWWCIDNHEISNFYCVIWDQTAKIWVKQIASVIFSEKR